MGDVSYQENGVLDLINVAEKLTLEHVQDLCLRHCRPRVTATHTRVEWVWDSVEAKMAYLEYGKLLSIYSHMRWEEEMRIRERYDKQVIKEGA